MLNMPKSGGGYYGYYVRVYGTTDCELAGGCVSVVVRRR